MPKKQHYALSNGKLYLEKKNKMFTTFQEVPLPEYETLSPQWHGKKIPMTMWQEILAFMKHSYDELKAETMCFLYYDEKKKQPWSFWVPPQITSGMTVKSDPEHINFQVERAQYPDIMFGTVHHHCSTSAFQSGTDEADETNREGFHFTIGNLDKKDIDIHFRWCLDNECHELEDLSIAIGGAESPFKESVELTQEMYDFEMEYMNQQFAELPDLKQYDFTKYMDNVSRPKAKPFVSSYQFGSKKNTQALLDIEDTMTISDIIEDLLFQVKFDPEVESAIQVYYSTNERDDATRKIEDLIKGHTTEEEFARVISSMLQDSTFLLTRAGRSFQGCIDRELDIHKGRGYILSDNDIINELNAIADNNAYGITI